MSVESDNIVLIDKIQNIKCVTLEKEGGFPIKWACLSKEQIILFQRIYRKLYNNKKLSDVQVHLGKHTYYFHSLLLLRSAYFKPQIEAHKKKFPDSKSTLDITLTLPKHIKVGDFELIMKGLYKGKLPFPMANEAVPLYILSKFLGIPEFVDVYLAYMGTYFTPVDACRIMEYAQRKGYVNLYDVCVKLVGKYVEKIFKSDLIYSFSKGNMIGLIQNSSLNINEIDLFNSVKRYCEKYAKDNNLKFEEVFKEFEEHIRWPLFSSHELISVIEPMKLVDRKYLKEAYKYIAMPSVLSDKYMKNSPRTKVRGSMAVRFRFESTNVPQYVTVTDKGMRCTTSGSSYSRTVFGNVTFTKKGIYFFEFKIVKTLPSYSYMMFGVADKGVVPNTQFLGNNARGWAIYMSGGTKYNTSRSTNYAKAVLTGGNVGVVLDLTDTSAGKIFFILDGKSYGEAFGNITPPVSPAVTLYSAGDIIEIVKNPRLVTGWRNKM